LRLTRIYRRQYQRAFTAKSCRRLLSSSSESDATSSITSRVGLLMDMDNLLIPDNEGQFEDTDVLKAVLKESQKYGRVVVRKAYMDSNQWSSIRQELAARAIEIVDMPILNHHSQKNSADIKLSVRSFLCSSLEIIDNEKKNKSINTNSLTRCVYQWKTCAIRSLSQVVTVTLHLCVKNFESRTRPR